jgi:hypothetical protein
MTEKPVPSANKEEFLRQHTDAWRDLQTLIAPLDAEQMVVPADAAGWNVRDHIAHLCAWQSTRLSFLEKGYHWDAFGIDEEQYRSINTDQVNEILRDMTRNLSPSDAMDMLGESTQALRDVVLATDEETLLMPAAEFHPAWPRLLPDFRVLDIVWMATTRHFHEHRVYIERIVTG